MDEGKIDEKKKAMLMIEPRNLMHFFILYLMLRLLRLHSYGQGIAAAPGAACGKIVFTAEDAKAWAAKGEKVVLVRLETSPEDITGYEGCSGYSYRTWWTDITCSSSCTWYGCMLRIRMEKSSWMGKQDFQAWRQGIS